MKARAEGDLLSYLISPLPWEDLQGVRHRGRLPTKNAAQSVYQAMKGLGGLVADLPDNAGLSASEQVGVEMYLKPELEATETILALKGRKFRDKREVVAGHPRIAVLRTRFELHGSYSPRDPKEAAQYGVDTIRVDLPRSSGEFNQFIDVIPDSALSRHRPTNGIRAAVDAAFGF